MQVSVAALFGAVFVIVLNRMDIVELLEKEVEWPSLSFSSCSSCGGRS